MKAELKTQHRKGIHMLFIFSIQHIYGGIEEKNLVLYLQTQTDCGNSPGYKMIFDTDLGQGEPGR